MHVCASQAGGSGSGGAFGVLRVEHATGALTVGRRLSEADAGEYAVCVAASDRGHQAHSARFNFTLLLLDARLDHSAAAASGSHAQPAYAGTRMPVPLPALRALCVCAFGSHSSFTTTELNNNTLPILFPRLLVCFMLTVNGRTTFRRAEHVPDLGRPGWVWAFDSCSG